MILDNSDYIFSSFVASPKGMKKDYLRLKKVHCHDFILDDCDDKLWESIPVNCCLMSNVDEMMEISDVLSKPCSSGSSLSKLVTLQAAELVTLQAAEGYWSLDTALASIIGRSLSDLKGASPSGCSDVVWGTLLAIVLLESRFSSQHDEWELVVMKAEIWLQGQVLPPGSSISSLKETAEQSLP